MIEFYKCSGSGNDFILIDNTNGSLRVKNPAEFAKKICRRKVSVGADGLIIIERSDSVDFRWRFFNSDGSEPGMCGNGGRCAARFAFMRRIAKRRMSFETLSGIIDAEVDGENVKIRLTAPHSLVMDECIVVGRKKIIVDSINTGVPHTVCFVDNLEGIDVFATGRAIRMHKHYRPAGTNANFVSVSDPHTIHVRTYERGVEDETLACGTGSVASALIASRRGWVESPVDVHVRSGEVLKIYFKKTKSGFKDVYLEGKVTIVYRGYLLDKTCMEGE